MLVSLAKNNTSGQGTGHQQIQCSLKNKKTYKCGLCPSCQVAHEAFGIALQANQHVSVSSKTAIRSKEQMFFFFCDPSFLLIFSSLP